jgi:hypothetical protein
MALRIRLESGKLDRGSHIWGTIGDDLMNVPRFCQIAVIRWFVLEIPPGAMGGGQTNTEVRSENTNTTNELSFFCKTLVDKESGKYAVVDSKQSILILKDVSGKMIWSVDIGEILKTNENSRVRGQKITGVEVYKGNLSVKAGRGYATIDIKTGRLIGIESN